jgi:hypothetical protein
MGRNTMRSSVNNAMRQRLFTEYLNEQKLNKMNNYYVYAQGILNLWALVYTTTNKDEANDIASQYKKSKVTLKRM